MCVCCFTVCLLYVYCMFTVCLLYVYCRFTVCLLYISTSIIQRSHQATIVPILMLLYLLYFCVSVYMYMFLCTRHHSLLIVSCVCILGGRTLITKSINQSINNNLCIVIIVFVLILLSPVVTRGISFLSVSWNLLLGVLPPPSPLAIGQKT